jgi:hypothetical protein
VSKIDLIRGKVSTAVKTRILAVPVGIKIKAQATVVAKSFSSTWPGFNLALPLLI